MLSPGDSPKAVRIKDGLISPLLLILLGDKRAPPSPTPPPLCFLAKRFYLSSASSSASPPPPPSRPPRNQRNHHAEPLLLLSIVSIVVADKRTGLDGCGHLIAGIASLSLLHENRSVSTCAWTRTSQSACGLMRGYVTGLLPLTWTNPAHLSLRNNNNSKKK